MDVEEVSELDSLESEVQRILGSDSEEVREKLMGLVEDDGVVGDEGSRVAFVERANMMYEYEKQFEELLGAIPYEEEELSAKVAELADVCRRSRHKFENSAEGVASITGVSEDDGQGFFEELRCDEFTFVRPLVEVLEGLPKGFLEGEDIDIVLGGFGESLTEEVHHDAFAKTVFFRFELDYDEYSPTTWNQELGVLAVNASRRGSGASLEGLLVEPFSGSPSEVAEYLSEELFDARGRFDAVLELERVSASLRHVEPPYSYEDFRDANHGGVISAGGIGEGSVESLVNMFGSPSNIVPYGEEGLDKGVSTAYGNEPDTSTAYEQCVEATERFMRFKESGDIDCAVSLEELFGFPKTKGVGHTRCTPHTEWEDMVVDTGNWELEG